AGFTLNAEYFAYLQKIDPSKTRWHDLERGRPPAIKFWYRTSPRELAPVDVFAHDRVEQDDPPRDISGMALVVLDTKGRLLDFEAVPPQMDPKDPVNIVDWAPLIAAAGLETAQLVSAQPAWFPSSYADTRAAWTGAFPELPKIPIRVEAAACRGKPISFRVVWPWTKPTRQEETEKPARQRAGNLILLGIFVTVLVGSILVARRNVRLGRGDRRGALRLAAFVGATTLAGWAFGATHVGSSDELRLIVQAVGLSLFAAGLVGILYLAIEPFVRRPWPQSIVYWTRVRAGQLRDPVVGRDILIGVLTGIGWTLLSGLRQAAVPPQAGVLRLGSLLGARFAASFILENLFTAVFWALA